MRSLLVQCALLGLYTGHAFLLSPAKPCCVRCAALACCLSLCRPSEEELASFGQPDFTIYNAGAFPANRYTSYMTSPTSIDVSLNHHEMVGGWVGGLVGG